MAVDQAYVSLRDTTQQDTYSIFERLKDQLMSIPPTPSDITEVQSPKDIRGSPAAISITETSTLRSETIQSSATSFTAPTCSTHTTDSSFCKSGLAILSKPIIFSVQQVCVAPGMSLSNELQSVWIRQIKEPLRRTLHLKDRGSCVQEFMMAGRDQSRLKPTVVITCGDAKIRKQVERIIKDLVWLRTILKREKIGLVVVNDLAQRSAGLVDAYVSGSGKTVTASQGTTIQFWLEHVQGEDRYCGRRLELASGQSCTIGGIVLIDEVPYGLTAAHAFESLLTTERHDFTDESTSEESAKDELVEAFWLSESDEEEEGSSQSSPSTWSKANEDEGDLSLVEDIEVRTTLLEPSTEASVSDLNAASSALTTPTSSDNDWATISFGDLLPTQVNFVTQDAGQMAEPIVAFASDISQGDVQIVTANQVYHGYLHNPICTLQIDSLTCDAYLISTNNMLPLGSSGSWVISHNNELLGHVIAVRQKVPFAYMVPIHSTLRDLKAKFGTENIRLPGMMPRDHNRGARMSSVTDQQVVETSSTHSPTETQPDGTHESISPGSRDIEQQNRTPRQDFRVETSYNLLSADELDNEKITALESLGQNQLDVRQNELFLPTSLCYEYLSYKAEEGPSGNLWRQAHRLSSRAWPKAARRPYKPGGFGKHAEILLTPIRYLWTSYERRVVIAEFLRRRDISNTRFTFYWRLMNSYRWYLTRPSHPTLTSRLFADSFWISTLALLRNMALIYSFTVRLMIFSALVFSWYLVAHLLFAVYYVTWPVHGPWRLWVIQRHRSVILDKEELENDDRWSMHILESDVLDSLRQGRAAREAQIEGRLEPGPSPY